MDKAILAHLPHPQTASDPQAAEAIVWKAGVVNKWMDVEVTRL